MVEISALVEIPYSFKLLYHELQAMNIQMRIITEDNVEQLTSLKNSNNINLLTGLQNFKEVIRNTIGKLSEKEDNDLPEAEIKSPPQQDYEDDIYPEMSPASMSPDWESLQNSEKNIIGAHELPGILLRENIEVYVNNSRTALKAKIIMIEKEGEVKDWVVSVTIIQSGELIDVLAKDIFVYIKEDNIEPPLSESDKQTYWDKIKEYVANKSPEYTIQSPEYTIQSPEYTIQSPTYGPQDSPISLDVQELPEIGDFNLELGEVYEPVQYNTDVDESSKPERIIKDLVNTEGLDILKTTEEVDEITTDDGVTKSVNVN